MTVDDPVLHLLGLRQLALVRALECRGHAAMRPIDGDLLARMAPPEPVADEPVTDEPAQDDAAQDAPENAAPAAETPPEPLRRLPPDVQRMLDEARGHPDWSSIGEDPAPDARREALVGAMAQALFAAL
jgi:hypothetical protein